MATVRLAHTIPGFDHRKVGFHVVSQSPQGQPIGQSSRVNEKSARKFAAELAARRPNDTVSIYRAASSPSLAVIEVDDLLEVVS